MTQAVESLLEDGAAALGIDISLEQITILYKYINELRRWNQAINLTGARTTRELVIKHVLDSLTGLLALPASIGRLVDIGTGAGLPGIPLKIVRPTLEATLIESTNKKAAFLINACAHLGLQGVRVVCERAERFTGTFDIAVARAVGPPARVAGLARPLVRPGGHLLLYLGPRGPQAIGDRPPAGWHPARTVTLTLPFGAGERVLGLWERLA